MTLCEVCNWPDDSYGAVDFTVDVICDDCWLAMKPIVLSRIRQALRSRPKPKDVETAGSRFNRYRSIESAFAAGLEKGACHTKHFLCLSTFYKLVRRIRGVE